ncbi:MAG TPA: glycosyl transferase [Gammaproteobacteria bacterium]|nr:glycosyl transferase [Gammaproteobacteria bacterium]
MGDFFQNGVITTFHNLNRRSIEALEEELLQFSKQRPMSLVLPSLFSELQAPALDNIVNELCKVPYLEEIVIGLDVASKEEFEYAKKYFSRLPQHHRILWNDGPRLREIDATLKREGLAPINQGKGRNVWYCYGYILASGKAEAIALHDCDIVTYQRDLLARLIYPVANPHFSYEFCKGYYARISSKGLSGRVSRLLVTPLIRALRSMFGPLDYLQYLDSFRYPLAGEFSMRADVIKDIRIPSDWGLEIGVLSEVNRNYSHNHLCQVDIADVYDHKHQPVSADNPDKGLSKMSTDISKAMFRKLATAGITFNGGTFRTLKATYYRIALDLVESFYADAVINGLPFDRHSEEKAIELFSENIIKAGDSFISNPMETPFIHNWNRVVNAIPNILKDIYDAVEEDSQ